MYVCMRMFVRVFVHCFGLHFVIFHYVAVCPRAEYFWDENADIQYNSQKLQQLFRYGLKTSKLFLLIVFWP